MDNKLLNDFTGTVRRAVDDYDMIQAGDKVAVVSPAARTACCCSWPSTT